MPLLKSALKNSLLALILLSFTFAAETAKPSIAPAKQQPVTTTIKFKDLDDNHWAAKSVYNCVRLGLTKGYPDGTFRGEKPLNRYELMVFLSNLAIAMEKNMDDKLENNMLAGEGEVNNRAVEELKVEIEALKEQMAAITAEGSTLNYSLKSNFKVFIEADSYAGKHLVKGLEDYTRNEYFQRLKLMVGNDYGNFGFKAGLDTGYVVWGNTAPLASPFSNKFLEGEIWAEKPLNENFIFKFKLTKGPGQVMMANKKILQRQDDALHFGFDCFGVQTDLKYALVGTTENVTIDDVTGNNLQVNKFEPSVFYTIPVALPYLGFWTIGFTMQQYTTETNRDVNDILRTSRYIQTNKFEITDKVTWETKHIKEIAAVPTKDEQGDPIRNEAQGFYYDTSFKFGDLFNSGTNWEIMYTYYGDKFGRNGLLEDVPGINYLGYSSCNYFKNDWQNINRIPSADITTESGIKIKQNLYKNILFLNLIYIAGTAIPESDDDNTKYFYKMSVGGFSWQINEYFTAYLNVEQKELEDTSIENERDQYSDSLGICGLNCKF